MTRAPISLARGFVRAALVVASLCAVATSCGRAPLETPENVLMILVEDQGAHLGALGTPGLETPHIDALAAEGVYFTEAFSVYPVCSASKAAFYTGRAPHTNGLRGNTANFFKPAAELTDADRAHPLSDRLKVADAHPTLVEVLHGAGYQTAVTHKLHVLPNEKFPFDRYQRTTSVDDVRDLIGALASNGAPWFLVLNVKGAHRPFRNSDETEIGVDPDDVRLPGHLPDTPTVRRDWAEYLDAIELTDELVGETLAILRETGQMDRTLVVYTSDHGPAFQRGKMSLHDLGVRVPLVFSGPGVEGGRRSSALASSVDLMPTLLDLLAIESDIPFDGRSLAPLLAGGADTAPPRYVFGEIDHQVDRHDRGMRERSVYDGRHRLIWRDDGRKPRTVNADIWRWARWRNRTYEETVKRRADFPDAFRVLRQVDTGRLRARAPQRELYDLERDPDELVNLAGSVADRPTRLRLESALREWARATGDDSFGNAVNGSTDAARPARGGGGGE